MSHTRANIFDHTVRATNTWLKELKERTGWVDHQQVYHALRTVLHVLRDHLALDEVAALGAQFPLLIRGVYYEGWHPAGKPVRDRHASDFLTRVAKEFFGDWQADPAMVTRAVFGLLTGHLSSGEVREIRSTLPHQIRALWP